ncbi:MAG: hypothetical protein LBU90_02975 [Bacteroidales bacterium]|jgi:hypothetical protein|nr:hypothetical protein [Bacteroidales bacterium]
MKRFFTITVAALLAMCAVAQEEVQEKITRQALEVESLFPMFFTGGFHAGVGYRLNDFRVRVSVINGGTYNAETAGVHNSSADFNRFYKTSPGVFLGYNVWKDLEVYTFLEFHTFEIEQKSTGARQKLHSTDCGGGVGYQFFVWKGIYIQPAFHVYLRKSQNLDFGTEIYSIPNVDLSPVIRLGYRFWSRPKHYHWSLF